MDRHSISGRYRRLSDGALWSGVGSCCVSWAAAPLPAERKRAGQAGSSRDTYLFGAHRQGIQPAFWGYHLPGAYRNGLFQTWRIPEIPGIGRLEGQMRKIRRIYA